MKDIREGLQERLRHTDSELEKAQERVVALQRRREQLQALLQAENEEWARLTGQKDIFTSGKSNGATSLSTIIREVLADGKKHHLNEISEAATQRGYPFGKKAPGRVIHFALLGMTHGRYVEQLGDGFWKQGPEG